MKDNIYFFGEWSYYNNDEEEKEAKLYLQLWKKNLLKKISGEVFRVEIFDEQYVKRDPMFIGVLCQETHLALKIAVKVVHKFACSSIDKNGIDKTFPQAL